MSFDAMVFNLRKGGLYGWCGYWQRLVRVVMRTMSFH